MNVSSMSEFKVYLEPVKVESWDIQVNLTEVLLWHKDEGCSFVLKWIPDVN